MTFETIIGIILVDVAFSSILFLFTILILQPLIGDQDEMRDAMFISVVFVLVANCVMWGGFLLG